MVKTLYLRVIVENSKSDQRLIAKHGLCFLIEAKMDASKKVRILMDTGPSADVLEHNIKAMDINLRKVDQIVISHGHYDHTGGLIEALNKIGKQTLVIAHPKTFDLKLKFKPNLKFIGSPYRLSDVESAGGILLLSRSPVKILKGISTSGEVERKTSFEKVEGFWTLKDEKFVEDYMFDDQALYINIKDKGLVVISGCAHAGIINTIKNGQKTMGVDHVYAVIGGFHLKDANDEQIQLTIDKIISINPNIIAPCHCTGPKTINQLLKVFKSRCHVLKTGNKLEL